MKEALLKIREALIHVSEDKKAQVFALAKAKNPWFSIENIESAWQAILKMLEPQALGLWLNKYSVAASPKKVGIVMAGNIPMVGFHDLLCVLASGNKAVVKLSSNDEVLLKFVIDLIQEQLPEWKDKMSIQEKLTEVDAVIATGSDNTYRYFDHYFSKYPNIIRKNRSSVAVITGEETDAEIVALGNDLFQYFGLGCRNVSKIYLPENYPIGKIFDLWPSYSKVMDHVKYANNYDYNRSVYLLKNILHLDTGYVIAVETTDLHSPIAVLYYEKYKSVQDVKKTLDGIKDQIQCVVSISDVFEDAVKPGNAQCPTLSDYADGIDTMQFLQSI